MPHDGAPEDNGWWGGWSGWDEPGGVRDLPDWGCRDLVMYGLGESTAGATGTGTVDTGAWAVPGPTTVASGKPAGGAGWVDCDVGNCSRGWNLLLRWRTSTGVRGSDCLPFHCPREVVVKDPKERLLRCLFPRAVIQGFGANGVEQRSSSQAGPWIFQGDW